MRGVKRCLGLAVALSGLSMPVVAANLQAKAPPPPVKPVTAPAFSWNGFYLGAHFGGLRFNGAHDVTLSPNETTTGYGGLGGLLAGYNFDLTKDWLMGVEIDAAGTTANSHITSHGPGSLTTKIDAVSHARLRLGYETDSSVLFVAGGGAAAHAIQDAPQWNSGTTLSNYVSGYSLGLGIDHSFSETMIGRIEYIYDNFGVARFAYGGNRLINAQYTTDTVRAALIWKM